MAARKKATEEALIEIRALDIQTVPIRIVGDTPLIVHAWSEKAKRQMLEAQTKSTKTKAREARDPFDDFINSMYWITDKPESTPEAFEAAINNGAKWGFPAIAIKIAGNAAAYRMGWVKNQMQLRGTYFLKSEYGSLAEVKGAIPEMREDSVKIVGSSDLRYRAEFKNWHMDLQLEFNAGGSLTLEQIFNVVNLGGYVCGIGEWRPERETVTTEGFISRLCKAGQSGCGGAGHGGIRLGLVWCGAARRGMAVKARPGEAGCGILRHGWFRHGWFRHGWFRQGKAGKAVKARCVKAWYSVARPGLSG